MRCPSCNYDNPADASFCEECGTKLELILPACKAPVSRWGPILQKMRGALGATKPAASGTVSASPKSQIESALMSAAPKRSRASARRSRRCSPTSRARPSLMEDLDPEEARAIIDPALKLMIDAVHRYDGYVVQSTGDGIFALFGAPVAHEDHPQRALYAALRMQEEIAALLGESACRGRSADSEARVGVEHRRSGGALDHDRRGSDRIHADRAHHQSRLADADAGADPARSRSAERRASWSRDISRSSRSGRPESKASASRSTFTR